MESARIPENEIQRLKKLELYQILDTSPEEAFDRITRIVAETIGVPIALVSLVDRERQWFKSDYGLGAAETPRDLAFCAHAILGDEIFEVPNALNDPRFADNPLVTEDPSIRFYAGMPLTTPDGYNLGTLCAIDHVPRELSESHRQLLQDLGKIVVDEMELRVALRNTLKTLELETKTNAMKDEFISNVTHELRTPLTSIRGSLGLMGAGVLGDVPEAFKEPLEIVDRNTTTLLNLINELLDVQKLSSGHMEYDFESVIVGDLIKEACENIRGMASEHKIKILFDSDIKTTIIADLSRIKQVITNVLSNAIKFSPEGEVVEIKLVKFETFVSINIYDKGPGISEEFKSHIFNKFSQAKIKTSSTGTGLGLSISKTIVEAHQGRIHFDTKMGFGTTFFVELPIKHTAIP